MLFHLNQFIFSFASNLPTELKDKILVKLPIKEVVRTSILSSKWKDSWISIPHLVFEEESTQSRLINFVDRVLLVHHGPILKFKLVSEHACNDAISSRMLVLSRNKINDLELCFDRDERCKIPSHFFSCVALQHVNLSGCIINVPRFFQCFNLLQELFLDHFDLLGFGIEKLVSSCPLLVRLILSDFVQQGCLNIRALNLRHLHIFGEFHDLCLETPKLAFGSIFLVTRSGDHRNFSVAKDGNGSNITRALGCLSNIQDLEICADFMDYLAMGPVPKKLPIIFNHLKELAVRLCTSDQDELATAICLFQNAPNLKALYLKFSDYVDEDQPHVQTLWESEAIKDCLFKCLEIVFIIYDAPFDEPVPLRIAESMLEFAKLVLRTAPVLEELSIIDLEDGMAFVKKLESFPKLSKKAEVVFVKRGDDSCGE